MIVIGKWVGISPGLSLRLVIIRPQTKDLKIFVMHKKHCGTTPSPSKAQTRISSEVNTGMATVKACISMAKVRENMQFAG